MKKLFCLLMAALLCMSAAMAETVKFGQYEITVPKNWRVAETLEEGDVTYLKLQEIPETPVQVMYVTSSDVKNWATFANDQQAMLNQLAMMARVFEIADGAADGESYLTGYMTLRDGGMAWRGTYKTETGETFGRLIMLHEGKDTVAYIAEKDGDAQQYLKLLDEMIRPMRVAEEVEAGGMRLALPAGWQRHEGQNDVFFSLSEASGSLAAFYTLNVAAKDIKEVVDAGQLNELLIEAARTVFASYEYSDIQAESVDLGGIPAIIAGMNIKMNGNVLGMGVLSALVDDKLVCGMVMTATGAAQDGLEWMKVMVSPMMETRPLELGNQAVLAYPQDFVNENTDVSDDGVISVQLVNPPLSFVTCVTGPVSDEELAQGEWDYLYNTLGYSKKSSKKYYTNGAVGVLTSTEFDSQGRHVAYVTAGVVHENRLIQMEAGLVDGTVKSAEALVASLLFEEAADGAVKLGELKINVPAGMTLEGDGAKLSGLDNGKEIVVYMEDMPENMRDAIVGMGEQTALEIYLSILADTVYGAQGVTIEYTSRHYDMAMVRTSFMYKNRAVGLSYMRDGNTLYTIVTACEGTEADGLKMLNDVLGYTK